jgi:hypothetical protein
VLKAEEKDDKITLTSHVITTLPQRLHKYLPDPEKTANLLVIGPRRAASTSCSR